MSKNPRFLLCLLGFAGASLLLTACGIEEFPQLNPPDPVITPGDNVFEFAKTEYNSESYFKGFELYYKMFEKGDSPGVDVSTFQDLSARGYRRINSASDRTGNLQRPLMRIHEDDRTQTTPLPPGPVDATNNIFSIAVDFSSSATLIDPYPQYDISTISSGPVDTVFVDNASIRRGVNYTDIGQVDEFKKFTEFSSADVGKDITTEIWNAISSNQEVKIVLYVVSYGFDFGDFTTVYSVPKYLGEVDRIFPSN
jgi:hypothetical protein